MAKEQYVHVKQVFFEALDLPFDERIAYINEACGGNQQVREEVETLLQHHRSATILTVSEKRKSDDGVKDANVIGAATLPHLAEETRDLLRGRLQAVVLVLCLGLALVLLRQIIRSDAIGAGVRVVGFFGMLVCFGVLWSRVTLNMVHLRMIEMAVLANVGLLFIVLEIRLMLHEAALEDAADVVEANAYNYLGWTLVIMIYGIFMPNTWQRAAAILVPGACIPYLVTFGLCIWSETIAEMLGNSRYGLPVPAPFLAAFTSIYAAHLIHTVRRDAFCAKQYAQYRLNRMIGAGGMGEVYEAEHLLLKRPCAIKLIHKERYADPKALARFEREVKATARLTHPNTIEIFDYGQIADGTFYYVMELLPGMSLAELIERHGPLPPARAIYLLRQICGALQEAHDQGLIHRDIKPANIFAAERGGMYDVAKLLDFGLVRETEMNTSTELTGLNFIAGTPHYMSPEQATAYSQADARSDLYSLGCVAYYLVTGQPPFRGESTMSILLSHANAEVEAPSRFQQGFPIDLDAVIVRCLCKSPHERFQSAAELEQALAACDCSGEWTGEDAKSWWQSPDRSGATSIA